MNTKQRLRRGLALATVIGAVAAPSASAMPHEQLYAGAQADQRGNRAPKTVVQPAPSRFDWGDAGIGAGATLALTAIAGGAVVIIRNRPRRETVA